MIIITHMSMNAGRIAVTTITSTIITTMLTGMAIATRKTITITVG